MSIEHDILGAEAVAAFRRVDDAFREQAQMITERMKPYDQAIRAWREEVGRASTGAIRPVYEAMREMRTR